MNRLTKSFVQTLRGLVDGWNSFWFAPSDPAPLCLIRLFGGAMLFYTHLVWSFDLEAFFGATSWTSEQGAVLLKPDSFTWSYFWLIDSPAVLWTVHILALVVFAMLALGLFTRIVSVLAFLAALSYVHRVPGALFGLDQINGMLAMYLMIGPSGAYFSLDRLLARRRGKIPPGPVPPSTSATIATRLIQIHMCIIYLFAGMSKLTGLSWWDGTAMWLSVANLEYQSVDMTWMARWPRLVNLCTHATVFWEVYYCALIWPRRLRPLMLMLAVPMHLGIAVCLGMVTFGLIMLIANIAFIPPWVLHAVFRGRGRADQDSGMPPASEKRPAAQRPTKHAAR